MTTNRHFQIARHPRAIGVLLIALSFARWPATVLIATASWSSAVKPWHVVLALQVAAELMFWSGIWLIGRDKWTQALHYLAAHKLARSIATAAASGLRGCRGALPVSPPGEVPAHSFIEEAQSPELVGRD